MKGGFDLGGDGDDVVRVDEGDEAREGVLKCGEEFVGCRMNGGQFSEDLLRSLCGVNLFSDASELGLIFVEVGVGDFEKAVERDVDHLVVAEFFGEGRGAELVVAGGAW